MTGSLYRLGGWKPENPPPPTQHNNSKSRSKQQLQARIDADPRFTAPGPEDDWWKSGT
jgi:hypothetical protein